MVFLGRAGIGFAFVGQGGEYSDVIRGEGVETRCALFIDYLDAKDNGGVVRNFIIVTIVAGGEGEGENGDESKCEFREYTVHKCWIGGGNEEF